ncbi:hypothetical protein BC829DRAFT_380583 [Chytridium lagenaria]|nr:hypothetical protein BC829DRAFT_380583 [Chytridium lagenaria]
MEALETLASSFLVSLRYDTVLPIARACLFAARSVVVILLVYSWCLRGLSGDMPKLGMLMYPVLGKVDEKETDTFGLALVFYLVLLILHDIQQTRQSNHMKTLGAFTHLTLWCLHTFTMTTLLASLFSTYLARNLHAFASSLPLPIDFYLCALGVAVEIMLSRWTVSWRLFSIGFAGVLAMSYLVHYAKFMVMTWKAPVMCPGTCGAPTMEGIGMIIVTFMMEAVFPVVHRNGWKKGGVCLEKGVNEFGENGNGLLFVESEEGLKDEFFDDSRLFSALGYSVADARIWKEEVCVGLLSSDQ